MIEMGNTPLAIILAITAYALLYIGLVLEKKGASMLPKIEGQGFFQNIKNFLTNKIWMLGLILTSIQWWLYAIALKEGSLSLVTPLLGVGLVVLVIFSFFYLKEPITKVELIAMTAVIIGVVILGTTNPNTEPEYTIEQANGFLAQPNSIIFIIILILGIIIPVLYSVSRKYKQADIIFGIASGIAAGLGNIFTKIMMTGIVNSDLLNSILFIITQIVWWLYVVFAIGGNTISMVLSQIGFQKGKSIVVTPLYSVFSLIIPVFGGVIIFSDWVSLDIGIIIAKVISLVIIIVGVGILSFFSAKSDRKQ
jgi:drug/metabolite transporter (DMT)-like permease